MGTIKSTTAFTAEFTHTYYDAVTPPLWTAFEVNKSLTIEPTAATAELLRGARMLFRATPKGFAVLYKSYLDTSPVTPVFTPFVEIADTDMVFTVKLNPKDKLEFLNYTKLYTGAGPDPANLGVLYSPEKVVYLSKTSPGAITYDLIDQLRPDLFTFDLQLPDGSGNADITVRDEANNVVLTFNGVVPDNNIYSVQIDLRGKPKGKYKLTADPATGPNVDVTFYVDNDLYGTDVFAIVKLRFLASFYTTPGTYTHEFQARKTQWRYYVVIRTTPSGTLTVSSNDVNFSFPLLDTLTLDGFTTKVFHSYDTGTTTDQYIPFRKSARTSFALLKDGIVPGVIREMPNPKVNGFDSDRYTQITAPTSTTFKKNVSEMFVFVDGL